MADIVQLPSPSNLDEAERRRAFHKARDALRREILKDGSLTEFQRLVGIAMLEFVFGLDRYCSASIETLAECVAGKERAVRMALRALEGRHFTAELSRGGKPSRYYPIFPQASRAAPEGKSASPSTRHRHAGYEASELTNPAPPCRVPGTAMPGQPGTAMPPNTLTSIPEPQSEGIEVEVSPTPAAPASGDAKAARAGSTSGETTPDGFDEFWATCPKQEGRRRAIDEFRAIVSSGRATPAVLIDAMKRYGIAKRHISEPRWIKAPASWLRDECWLENPKPPKPKEPRVPKATSAGDKPPEPTRGKKTTDKAAKTPDNHPAIKAPEFKIGDTVYHVKDSIGSIVDVGIGKNSRIMVRFNNGSARELEKITVVPVNRPNSYGEGTSLIHEFYGIGKVEQMGSPKIRVRFSNGKQAEFTKEEIFEHLYTVPRPHRAQLRAAQL